MYDAQIYALCELLMLGSRSSSYKLGAIHRIAHIFSAQWIEAHKQNFQLVTIEINHLGRVIDFIHFPTQNEVIAILHYNLYLFVRGVI